MKDSEVKNRYEDFLNGFDSLCMSTVGNEGWPLISYAPFVVDDNRSFYVFLSDLAKHTSYLRESGKASVMFIEDEDATAQIFARTRVIFQCEVIEMTRSSKSSEGMLSKMEDRFGELLITLRSLSDFHLFRLSPKNGTFVMGFGQAYSISGKRMEILNHVKIEKK